MSILDGIRAHLQPFRMTRADADAWRAARTLHDLAQLTARWLEGDIASQPGYAANCGPDEETAHLVPVLAAANRAGYLTDGSQPGVPAGTGYDGATWSQRAAVSGFASADLAQQIGERCAAAGMLVYTYPPAPDLRGHARFRERGGATVTTREGRGVTWFGSRHRPKDIRFSYGDCGGCHADAVAAVEAAHQITVIDPEWGRDDLLWPVLAAATRGPR